MIKGYIFDYGGTLDTGGQHWGKVMWHAYERQQVPVTEADFREAYVYAERTLGKNLIIKPDFSFKQTLKEKIRIQMEFLIGERKKEKEIRRYEQALVDDLYAKTVEETSRSREVLMRLKKQYPIVLVSNFYGNLTTVLREFKLDGLFQAVIESAIVGVRKPDSTIFKWGVEALKLNPDEVIVVGDSMEKDIIPAHKAGCHTIWFKGEGWNNNPIDESIADGVITTLAQVNRE